jgi:hypothetical protein
LVLAENKSSKNVLSKHTCKLIPDSPTKGLYQYLEEMNNVFFIAAILMLLLATGCQTDQPSPGDTGNTDDITKQLSNQEHVTGALNPFKLIENPHYAPVNEINYLNDNHMVFLTRATGDVRIFPHRNMGVEVVNEDANGVLIAITYCPITKSGIIWNRVVGIDTLLLTASGYLYKDNMMPLDLNSGNIWSQMLLRRFQGDAREGEIFGEGMMGLHDGETLESPLY